MRPMLLAWSVAGLLLCVRLAVASEIPYGADALPYLASHATAVVEVSRARLSPEADPKAAQRFSAYELTVGRVVPGEKRKDSHIREGATVRVVLPKELDVAATSDLNGSTVFLRGPLSAEESQTWGLDPKTPTYAVVSGRYGVISDGKRRAAAEDYVKTTPDRRLDWAATHVTSDDSFLQRSALLEAGNQAHSQPERAVQLLGDSLKSDKVSNPNKRVAINALESSRSPQALAPIKEMCKNDTAPQALRFQAIQAMASVPGGLDVLREWRGSGEKLLAPKSKEVLEKFAPAKEAPPAPPGTVRQIQGKLRSAEAISKREAIAEASRFAGSDELLGALHGAANEPKQELTVKLAAVEGLAKFNNKPAADALAAIAKDKEQPALVRSSALLALSRMETGISAKVLKQLADELTDKDLKAMAAGLGSES